MNILAIAKPAVRPDVVDVPTISPQQIICDNVPRPEQTICTHTECTAAIIESVAYCDRYAAVSATRGTLPYSVGISKDRGVTRALRAVVECFYTAPPHIQAVMIAA